MQIILEVTVPVFLIIGFGYAVVWRKLLSAGQTDGLMGFAQGIAIPCLLFRAVSQMDLGSGFNIPMLVSFYASCLVVFYVGMLGARFLFGRPWEDSVVIGFACLFSNSVLLGLAIVGRAFDEAALEGCVVIVAFHAPFCYLLGISTMEIVRSRSANLLRTSRTAATTIFKNPIMLGIFLGMAFNLLDVALPSLVADAVDMLARSALPAALFALGGVLVRYRPEGEFRVIAWIGVLGLIIHPAVTWGLSHVVFGLNASLVQGAVITAAMAPGVNAYIFSNMYGRAKRVVASSVLLGTAFSIATGSAWIAIVG